ncbi:MAG TPA: sulfite exporter TauE/SafE family protein [Geminicoccaceae bacterium]|nr:sulfite exporter TauE/SafE family protein [Geminicoccaceae bacterium]
MGDFLLFVAVGFAAQIVDGAIGMAYGLTATTVLLSIGVLPAAASASVHAAEVFTTGASGLSHWHFRNVDFALLRRLVLPGMAGGVCGVYVLTSVPGETIRPVVSAYLLAMGGVILWKALRQVPASGDPPRRVAALGLAGGFLDAVGGGGWGPLVTSTLVGQGTAPRYAIGSTNLAEFFVALTVSATFVATIGLELWPIIAGLVVGGVLAAPFAAYATQRLPDRPLMILVAVVIILLSLRGLVQAVSLVVP